RTGAGAARGVRRRLDRLRPRLFDDLFRVQRSLDRQRAEARGVHVLVRALLRGLREVALGVRERGPVDEPGVDDERIPSRIAQRVVDPEGLRILLDGLVGSSELLVEAA